MASRHPVTMIVESAENSGVLTPVSLTVFAECLKDDSLDQWAAGVRAMIADNRRTAPGVATQQTHQKDAKADRARQLEAEIARLQAELTRLAS